MLGASNKKGMNMTDKEFLREIERQEKRFAEAKSGRGRMLAKSARDYLAVLQDAEKKSAAAESTYKAAKSSLEKLEAAAKTAENIVKTKAAEAQKLRAKMVSLRKIVKNCDSLKSKANVARLRLVEKVDRLKTMPVE